MTMEIWGGITHAMQKEQLIAFFINKHLFLPHGLEKKADLERLDPKELSDMEYEQRERERGRKENLSFLKTMELSISMKTATTRVCCPICSGYMPFVRRVNFALGLNITLFHRCLEQGCISCRS
jgi:hypothetical protein